MIGEDLNGTDVRASDFRLETFETGKASGRQRPLSGGVRLWTEDASRKEDNLGKVGCGRS